MVERELTGTVIAVTGGARGIGLAVARAAARAGARVAIGDVDAEGAHERAAGLPGGALGGALDVRDAASFERWLDGVEVALGPLDVLVNNAGVMHVGTFVDEDDAWTRRMIEVNIVGVALGTRAALRRMLPRRRGHVVNVASVAARLGVAGIATYSATKHAVVGLTEAVGEEVRGSGVRLSTVLPAIVRTDLAAGSRTVTMPAQEPDDVAEAVLDVLRRGRRQVTVPRRAVALLALGAALPPRARHGLARRLGADAAYRGVPAADRRPYEERVVRELDRG